MVKQGYKKTEIGVIPEDWEVKTIREVTTIFGRIGFRGYTVKDIVKEGHGAISISPSNIKDGHITFNNNTYISWFKYDESPEIKIYNGDILLVKTGSTVGKTALVKNLKHEATLNPQVVVFKKLKINNEFLSYLILDSKIQNQIISNVVGGAIPTLSQELVYSFQIPLPPLAEQEAIASALSDADAWIERLEQLIAKKRLIKQGAMQTLLTPQEDWEVKKIREIVATPVTDGPHETPIFLDKGIPFLSVNNIVDNKIDWNDLRYISEVDDIRFSKKCKPRRGDILLGKAASVGKIAIIESDHNFNIWSPLALIRIDEISNKYCFYYLQTADVLNQIKFFTNTSSQGNIGMGDIEKIEIKYPKSLSEQERIATVLSDMDAELEALETQLGKARQIKQGMMQELLTGRVRLLSEL